VTAVCETAARDERRAPVASLGYTPRQAERTVLHQVVREHLETFLATTARADPAGLPAFLEQEFRGFLDCGIWSRDFARFQSDGGHAETLVPFSCKRRGFCPSCGGRRMAAGAAELVDHILPHVPVRQWVLSLPHALRFDPAPPPTDREVAHLLAAIRTRILRLLRRGACSPRRTRPTLSGERVLGLTSVLPD